MFEQFPKIRPSLPNEVQEIYASHYKSNREVETTASSAARRMESWLHRQVAKDVVTSGASLGSTLELGAGTLNQLHYEPDNVAYDIVEPFVDLYRDSPLRARVRNTYSDISEIPDEVKYDRITSVAVLEHICNLPQVVAESALRLTENGTFRAGVPSEGTLLWWLGWRLTTGLEFRMKYGQDYGLIMAHEHVNRAREIESVLKYFFGTVECKVFGLSRSLSIYRYYECDSPRQERCQQFG